MTKPRKNFVAFAGACLLVAAGWMVLNPLSPANKVPASFTPDDPAFTRDLSDAKKVAQSTGDWSKVSAFLNTHLMSDHPLAKFETALLRLKGWGVERDLEKARVLLLQAVQYRFDGRARAAFELGRVYRMSHGKDCNRLAFEWFSKSLKWGYKKAHAELAKAYARGLGVPINYDKAIMHYREAIDAGASSAIVPLFETALKQQQDGNADASRGLVFVNKYLPLLEADALDGKKVSARAMGRVLARGLFVEKDIQRAASWFSRAASLGDAVAMHDLAMLGITGDLPALTTSKVILLLEDSVELGYPAAMTALGRLYINHNEIRDPVAAIKYFEMGSRAGHPGATAELAALLFEGKYAPRDLKRAKALAERGARQNHRGSMKVLAQIARHDANSSKRSD